MNWGDALQNVNYMAAVAATIASGIIGFLWYGKNGFLKEWMKLVGLKQKDVDDTSGMAVQYAAMYVFYFLAAIAIAALMDMTSQTGGGDGALMGGVIGLVGGFGPLVSTYGFARRKFELSMIDGGYLLVTFVVMGAIVGMWQ